jgi:hypothetical protein
VAAITRVFHVCAGERDNAFDVSKTFVLINTKPYYYNHQPKGS